MIETTDGSAVREALQARLLVELMGNAMHKELVLKGGLAMRAVHGSVRYTKDIDLDADLIHPKERIHGIVCRSITRTVSSGLIDNARVTEPKQTDTTMRWKINGNMPGSSAPMQLTVEISRRASLMSGHIIEVPMSEKYAPGGSGVKIQVLDSQAIAVTKIMALTDPRRMAPRDMYDLFVLIKAEIQEPSVLLSSLPAERLQEAINELWPKLELMTFKQFSNEVIPFLPGIVASSFTEESFAEMQLTVGERVQMWLEAAERLQKGIRSPILHESVIFEPARNIPLQSPADGDLQTHTGPQTSKAAKMSR